MIQRLLIATTNPGKIGEYRELLEGLPYTLTTPPEEGLKVEFEEEGTSYLENATGKALAYVQAGGLLTVADDSGIEVDALGGRPGIASARYGGPQLSDEDRVWLLLRELREVPWEQRTARFRCVIALAWPEGGVETREGVLDGMIAYEPVGSNGFGYDPIFYLPDRGMTTAQLPPHEKHAVSHRGQAARKVVELLKNRVTEIV